MYFAPVFVIFNSRNTVCSGSLPGAGGLDPEKYKKGQRKVSVMKVKMIKSAGELESVAPFQVECLLWGTKEIPKTYGYLGFVPEDGFYLKMICEERDPLCAYEDDQAPVYRDSAMEAFFQFETEMSRGRRELYLNFEMNAKGALLAAYGEARIYRSYFSPDDMKGFACRATKEKDKWSVELKIPVVILEKIYGPLHLGCGSTFTCNFYKISETAEIEHYASYSPIQTDTPSFHLPEFFAAAEIVEE